MVFTGAGVDECGIVASADEVRGQAGESGSVGGPAQLAEPEAAEVHTHGGFRLLHGPHQEPAGFRHADVGQFILRRRPHRESAADGWGLQWQQRSSSRGHQPTHRPARLRPPHQDALKSQPLPRGAESQAPDQLHLQGLGDRWPGCRAGRSAASAASGGEGNGNDQQHQDPGRGAKACPSGLRYFIGCHE